MVMRADFCRLLLSGCIALVSGGCGKSLELNLKINDSCNQSVVRTAEHMELRIVADGLDKPVVKTWSAGKRKGDLSGLDPVNGAVVEMIGRASDGSGDPGLAILAGSVGYLDLSGESSDQVDVSVVVGRVNSFINTSVTADGVQCTATAV